MFTKEKVFLIINIVLLGIFCSTAAFAGPGYPSDRVIKEDLAKYLVNFQEKRNSVKGSVKVKFLSFDRRPGKEIQMGGTYYVVPVNVQVEVKHNIMGEDKILIHVNELGKVVLDFVGYSKTDRSWMFEECELSSWIIEKRSLKSSASKGKVDPPVYYMGEKWTFNEGKPEQFSQEVTKTEGSIAELMHTRTGDILIWDNKKGKFMGSRVKKKFAFEYEEEMDVFRGEKLYVGKKWVITRGNNKLNFVVEDYEVVDYTITRPSKYCSAFRIRKTFFDQGNIDADSYIWYSPGIKWFIMTRKVADAPNTLRLFLSKFSVKGLNMD